MMYHTTVSLKGTYARIWYCTCSFRQSVDVGPIRDSDWHDRDAARAEHPHIAMVYVHRGFCASSSLCSTRSSGNVRLRVTGGCVNLAKGVQRRCLTTKPCWGKLVATYYAANKLSRTVMDTSWCTDSLLAVSNYLGNVEKLKSMP